MNFSFHKTETTDAHLSSPSAKVFPFIEFLGDKSYCLFVWSRVRAEKTEEDTLGSEVATTFDGFSRHFVFRDHPFNIRSSGQINTTILSIF